MLQAGADKEVKEAKADLKANSDWNFIFSLAKQLHKTVAELCQTLTIEEMIGWAAFAELESEEYEKQKEQAQRSSALKAKRGNIEEMFFSFYRKWLIIILIF